MDHKIAVDLALVTLLLAAGVRDLAVRRIPNKLLLTGLAVALLLHLCAAAPLAALAEAALGFCTGLLVFLPLYLLRGMAAGDVKLMATVGAFTGPALAFDIALASCCIGGVMALVMIVAQGRVRAACANMASLLRPLWLRLQGVPAVSEAGAMVSVGSMPYGLAIALGSLLMLWIRHS